MKRLPMYLAGGLLVWLLLTGLLPGWLGLTGGERWFLRTALWLIGLSAAGLVWYFLSKAERAARPGETGLRSEMEFLVAEANRRLAGSPVRNRPGRASVLPLVLFVGDPGAGKTTAIVNSGLTPELIAGGVFEDGAVVSTRVANLWLGGQAILMEAGAGVLSDTAALSRTLSLLAPRTAANLVGSAVQAPRSVVICCECARFSGAGARNAAQEAARRYRAVLDEVAQRWGSRLPVYVLFTKLDQVRYFLDYFHNLRQEEAGQLFGAALPFASEPTVAYTEAQTRRLSQAFDSLTHSLGDARVEHLRRENDPGKAPNVYEFPREFRKMREGLVQFLLEIGRPSQLRASPYLRGFYFTGVRPLGSGGPAPSPVPEFNDNPGATRILGPAAFRGGSGSLPMTPGHRIPQWIFLSPLFANVLLGDRAAMAASGRGANARLVRRGLSAAAIIASLIWMTGATVSYSENRRLINAASVSSAAAEEALSQERYGAPMTFRWGVYPGPPLTAGVVSQYCAGFERAVLGPVRSGLADSLRRLPASPGATDDYQRPFELLRAYLMMTSEFAHAEPEFLRRFLAARSPANAEQFAFYASERRANICKGTPDAEAIGQARSYLWKFPLADQVYHNMLNDVAGRGQPYVFTDPAGAVTDPRAVDFAYTKGGWKLMQAALRDVPRYYSREPWVLGDPPALASSSPGNLETALRQRYLSDYTAQWQRHLAGAAVARYANLADAAKKLDAIVKAQSPLLRLFCGIAVNTAVDAPEIQSAFAPIQRLELPASCESNPIDAPVQQYMSAMVNFQVQVDQAKSAPPPVAIDGGPARIAAKNTAATLGLPDKAGQLLLDPILNVRVPNPVNGAGESFCLQSGGVFQRFPFRSDKPDLPIDEFIHVFAPQTGTLAALEKSAQDVMERRAGAGFVAKPGVAVRQEFLKFVNQADTVSRAFFAANPAKPSLTITIAAARSTGVDSFTIAASGRTLNGGGGPGTSQEFIWTPDETSATLSVTVRGNATSPSPFRGAWALFRLINSSSGMKDSVYEFPLTFAVGRQQIAGGGQETLRLRIDVKGFNSLLASLPRACVSQIVP
jgi:type VI secretion system protein ImpL